MALHDALALGQCFSTVWDSDSAHSSELAAEWMRHQSEQEGLGWRLGAALALYNSRRVDEVRRVVLASRHYGRLRNRLLPESAVLFGDGVDDGCQNWEDVNEEQYKAAVLQNGLLRPLQGQLMPTDPMLQLAPL